jgi:hypothetical protein
MNSAKNFLLFLISFFSTYSFSNYKNIKSDQEIVKNETDDSFIDDIFDDNIENYTEESYEGKDYTLENPQSLSKIININQNEKLRSFIHLSKSNDLQCEIDGKFRFDSAYGLNTRLLNSSNKGLDKFLVLGRSLIDLGASFSFGEEKFDRPIIEAALNVRNRCLWGKPEDIAATTSTTISDGDYTFGKHNHKIGVPLFYLRGLDFTLDLNAVFNIENKSLHFLKAGFFPFDLGRGISLGSAYGVSPDFINYDSSDVIQEYAPGIMLNGTFDEKKTVEYRAYLGILKNLSSSFSDVNEAVRAAEYGYKYKPQRDFGVFNIVGAIQFDWNIEQENKNKLRFSPYALIYHQGEGILSLSSDSSTELATFGAELNLGKTEKFEICCEFAKNHGYLIVKGLDTNSIKRENRNFSIATSPKTTNSESTVLTNSGVTYFGETNGIDIKNRSAIYYGSSDSRQLSISNVFQSETSNGKNIPECLTSATLQNNSDRFKDPYESILQGWMFVIDATYNFLNKENKKYSGSLAAGIASGDENPHTYNARGVDRKYEGFIGVQEVYSGKSVKSSFLMSGVGKTPRVLSFLSVDTGEDDTDEETDYIFPSNITRFSNLAYLGSSLNFSVESKNYKFKINPNLLYYLQVIQPVIYSKPINGVSHIPHSLGVEANIFLEASSINIDGLKFFGLISSFIPGGYYSALKKIPLNAKERAYYYSIEGGNTTIFLPTLGDNTAYYINLGIEFSF